MWVLGWWGSVCMAGAVGAGANVAVAVATGVPPLTCQTVGLQQTRCCNTGRKGSDHFLTLAGSTYLCSFDKLLRCIFLILLVAPPGSQRRRLQGSAKGESQDPRFGQRAVVDGVQVD